MSKHGVDYIHDATYYKSIVWALQYATITRPKISYDMNKVYQFMSQPIESHLIVGKRILRYLKGSLYHGLLLKHASTNVPLSIKAFLDDDWGADLDDRKSTSWSCIYLDPNLVSWWSKKQTLVAKSNTEVKYKSLINTSTKALWIKSSLLSWESLSLHLFYFVIISALLLYLITLFSMRKSNTWNLIFFSAGEGSEQQLSGPAHPCSWLVYWCSYQTPIISQVVAAQRQAAG